MPRPLSYPLAETPKIVLSRVDGREEWTYAFADVSIASNGELLDGGVGTTFATSHLAVCHAMDELVEREIYEWVVSTD